MWFVRNRECKRENKVWERIECVLFLVLCSYLWLEWLEWLVISQILNWIGFNKRSHFSVAVVDVDP